MSKRMDGPDTVDLAIHWLTKLQSEGWALADLEHHIDHVPVGKGGRKLPVKATLTIRLVPQ